MSVDRSKEISQRKVGESERERERNEREIKNRNLESKLVSCFTPISRHSNSDIVISLSGWCKLFPLADACKMSCALAVKDGQSVCGQSAC